MPLSIREQYIKEGYELGYKHGYKRGIRKMTLLALQLRFSCVQEAIQEQVRQIRDIDTLEQLFKAAILCQSLEEFQEKLP